MEKYQWIGLNETTVYQKTLRAKEQNMDESNFNMYI